MGIDKTYFDRAVYLGENISFHLYVSTIIKSHRHWVRQKKSRGLTWLVKILFMKIKMDNSQNL